MEESGCGAKRGFGQAAGTYEFFSSLFSGGLIVKAKLHQLKWLQPDSKVLYLGVGAGEDAEMAAKQKVRLTCLDISKGMLAQLERKLIAGNLEAELICGNALEHDRAGHYDAVVCNFFLNCFQEPDCIRMLNHAAKLLKEDGKLLIADVAAPRGNLIARLLSTAYIKTGMFFFWLQGMVSLHGIYDYRQYFGMSGLELVESTGFRLAGLGPVVYETIVARKPSR